MQIAGKLDRRLGEIAVGHKWVTNADLAKALADQFGLDYVDLSQNEPDRDAASLLQKELAFLGIASSPAGTVKLVEPVEASRRDGPGPCPRRGARPAQGMTRPLS